MSKVLQSWRLVGRTTCSLRITSAGSPAPVCVHSSNDILLRFQTHHPCIGVLRLLQKAMQLHEPRAVMDAAFCTALVRRKLELFFEPLKFIIR